MIITQDNVITYFTILHQVTLPNNLSTHDLDIPHKIRHKSVCHLGLRFMLAFKFRNNIISA